MCVWHASACALRVRVRVCVCACSSDLCIPHVCPCELNPAQDARATLRQPALATTRAPTDAALSCLWGGGAVALS